MTNAAPTVCDDIAILVIGCAAWMNRDLQRVADFLDAQLRAVLAAVPRVPRLDREARGRLAELANRIERARLEACARIVTVDTLRRWFRTLVARKWTHPRTGPGRPPIAPDAEQQIVTMARENPGWGVRGISQRLRLLGIAVSRATVRRVLRRNGIDPAPMRTRDSTWDEFLAAHAAQIAAIDFTTVECFDQGRLTTQYCLFAIHHDTRRVSLAGIHPASRHRLDGAAGSQSDRRRWIPRRSSIPDHGSGRVVQRTLPGDPRHGWRGERAHATAVPELQRVHRAVLP
ncbi:MAG: helix-turn-helix domain-containing protein [Planctomycetes bacterium]|nr:helix-turn-helix domain-containing protein [Planctomycetota bacterium]